MGHIEYVLIFLYEFTHVYFFVRLLNLNTFFYKKNYKQLQYANYKNNINAHFYIILFIYTPIFTALF